MSVDTEPERLRERPLELPSLQFKNLNISVKKQIALIERRSEVLITTYPFEQKKTIIQIVNFLRDEVLIHLEWEEKVLYPAIDRKVTTSRSEKFTSGMRYEHNIIRRWFLDLDNETKLRYPDARRFSYQAAQLIGLLKAHLEKEEELLLPILDTTMSPQQFHDEILFD